LVVACVYDAPEKIALNANESVAKAEIVMLESLAGLLLRHGSPGSVGLYLESNVDGRLLLQQLQKRRGVTATYANRSTTPFALAQQLVAPAKLTSSFVLFDAAANPQSTNVARMAASLHSALMVDRRAAGAAVRCTRTFPSAPTHFSHTNTHKCLWIRSPPDSRSLRM
jgi:hypothetical protein